VSVVVPTYRRPASLRRCLEGLFRVDYPPDRLEIVVVDDGGGIAPGLRAGLPPEPVLRFATQENRGPASARNRGARLAEGQVVAFTDDDCRPQPAWLAALVAGLVEEPAALVGGGVVNALPDNICAQASQDLVAFLYEYFPRGRALLPFFTSNNIACRREALLHLGGFDETFRFSAGEDRDFAERWQAEVGALRFRPGALVDHFHDLTLPRFLRQHHYYGRGAMHLARRRRLRGQGVPRPEPLSFYGEMLTYPVRTHGGARSAVIAGLVGLSQLAALTGMLVEAVAPSHPVRADDPSVPGAAGRRTGSTR
jgi:glycosyltransferase involved in cell wall biosynthesis